jgi:glycerophosphoryl diester phosphodiesterase
MVIGFAHRGARLEHPDNTLPGFARALTLGATGLESDAWVTADGVAVLDHDGVVRRGLRRLPIATLELAGLPPHIPRLADLYDLPGAGQVEVSLDVKDPAALPPVLHAAGPHRAHLWLCAGDVDLLSGWRSLDGEVHLVHSTSLRRIGPDRAGHARRLAGSGIGALNLRADEWSASLVGVCHAAGVRAFGWDAQRCEVITELVSLGLDAVYSDHVETMVRALGGVGAGGSEQPDAVERPDP